MLLTVMRHSFAPQTQRRGKPIAGLLDQSAVLTSVVAILAVGGNSV